MTQVTLDSNVYLSGFVFGGKPQRILELAIDGEIEVAVFDPSFRKSVGIYRSRCQYPRAPSLTFVERLRPLTSR